MPKTAKKPTRSKLIKKLDVVFSQYIRLKEADRHGLVSCYTCGKRGHWKHGGMQAGHFMSRKHYSTRWVEDNVKIQCQSCNIFQQGQQYLFSVRLGNKLAEDLYLQSKTIVKFTSDELQSMIDDYSEKVKRLL